MSNRTSQGLGAGFSVPTAGANIVLVVPSANFIIENTDSTNPVYVIVNAVAYTDNTYASLVAAVSPAGAIAFQGTGASKVSAANIVANGICIKAGQSKEFKGWAAFNGGAQIMNLALASTGGAVVVTGGTTDTSN